MLDGPHELNGSQIAGQTVTLIAKRYEIEREAREFDAEARLLLYRRDHREPVLRGQRRAVVARQGACARAAASRRSAATARACAFAAAAPPLDDAARARLVAHADRDARRLLNACEIVTKLAARDAAMASIGEPMLVRLGPPQAWSGTFARHDRASAAHSPPLARTRLRP